MIANGGSYRCVWWWADHLQSKENDRATVVKSYGLRSEDIHDMLSEMEVLAQGTRCQNFFYQMNLNPVPGEKLTEAQWDRVREIAEKHHGFEGQPYFVVEHVKHGRAHQHIVWSRTDIENMRAISDSKDARKNHAIAREIEQELGLQRVTGPYDREPGEPRPKRAPKPWEMYRGMKTGLDPRDIAAEVTELFQQSDNGPAFKAALEEHGYELVTGQRGLLILDCTGKEHSLARRIEGVNTKELNAFMRDIDRQALPTVEQAKAAQQERKITALEADRATVKQEIEWEEALANSAIEKEKAERRPITPEERGKEEAPSQEQTQPSLVAPDSLKGPAPDIWFPPPVHFGAAAWAATEPEPPPMTPENLKGPGARIWEAYSVRVHMQERERLEPWGIEKCEAPIGLKGERDPYQFGAALEDRGMALAKVTKQEAEQSRAEADHWKTHGERRPTYREGEFVVITSRGDVYRLNQRTTGQRASDVQRFLSKADWKGLSGIEETRQVMQTRAEVREIERQAFRDLSAVGLLSRDNDPRLGKDQTGQATSGAPLIRRGGKALVALANIAEEAIQVLGDFFGGATEMTPDRIRAVIDARERAAEEQEIDLARLRLDDAYDRGQADARERERLEEEARRYYERERERER